MVPVSLAWAAACGLALGLGLWLIATRFPRLAARRLPLRIAPYVVDVAPSARDLVAPDGGDPLPVIGGLFAPATRALRTSLVRMLGGSSILQLRLRQSDSALDLESYRSQQLLAALAGAALGAVLGFLGAPGHLDAVASAAGAMLVGAVTGVVVRDGLLRRSAARRIARIAAELPTVLEFLTLSLSAGEGVLDALRRVARVGSGELSGELRGMLTEVGTGVGLSEALRRRATELQSPPFTRCVDQLTVAIDRGSPLAEVLRAQAHDARDEARRALLEVAGKKEVAMLVPLVFLILPVTILFAIFPGVFVLQLGF